ncbi:MAG: phosphate acyltransferase PlsX [Chloroflexi bacterium]|nr:phosphate acyltransferase PlsX [Chloroflexota bacterium]
MPTIALDVMGGDQAPDEIVKGAFEAAVEHQVRIALVGPPEVLRFQMAREENLGARMVPVPATQVVGMSEPPTEAWRAKKDSSIVVGIRLIENGQADAFISAGNTGAIVTASHFILGTMEGIDRPAIATLYNTTANRGAMALDIGANADCRPPFLAQFARLGSDFMTKVFKVERPRVALLSNGSEESKGSKLIREAHKLLKESDLNFVGNIEGFDIHRGIVDVVVTDGFTGNVALKLAEGLTDAIFLALKDALGSHGPARASKFLWGPSIMSVAKQWDNSNVGGAPLLGINGNVVMAHGRSDATDIKNAIGLAARMIREGWWQPPKTRNPIAAAAHLNMQETEIR